MFLLAEFLLASYKYDLHLVLGGYPLHVLPDRITQWLGPFGVVENADPMLVAVVRHALCVAPLRYCSLHDDPVVTGKNASNPALVPFRQKLNAHLTIIPAFLFGSGYAGLGCNIPFPDRILRTRRSFDPDAAKVAGGAGHEPGLLLVYFPVMDSLFVFTSGFLVYQGS